MVECIGRAAGPGGAFVAEITGTLPKPDVRRPAGAHITTSYVVSVLKLDSRLPPEKSVEECPEDWLLLVN